MDTLIALFALGATSALIWPFLPTAGWLLPLFLLALIALYRHYFALFALLGGVIWMGVMLPLKLAWLDEIDTQKPQLIQGELLELKPSDESFSRLLLRVATLQGRTLFPKPLLRLNVYDKAPNWPVGSQVTLKVQLRPAQGLANPAGWDGRRALLGSGITATANLRSIVKVELAPPNWRERWLIRASTLWQDFASAPLLAALTFGEQQGITPEQWQLFRNSGLTHVVAISGQHIAIVALLGWWLGRVAGQRGALITAASVATLYSALAGFGVATERAWLMVLIFTLLRLGWRYWPNYRLWLWAMLLLIFWDPLSLFAAGFWLSFAAVALLMVTMMLWPKAGLWRIQLMILFGLLPLQLLLFNGIAPLAFLINLLALPIFTWVIIPTALIGVLLAPLLTTLPSWLFRLCDWLLQWLLTLLDWLNQQTELWWTLPAWALPLTLSVLLLLLAWPLPKGRWLLLPASVLLAITLFTPEPQKWRVHLIDVGQGLSVLLEDRQNVILFDSGDRFPNGLTQAEATILPLLHHLGLNQLTLLISSHNDRDHIGGRELLHKRLPILEERASFAFDRHVRPCQAGKKIVYPSLRLDFLWPEGFTSGNNNDSCVIRADFGDFSLLLTGDIEKEGEAELVRRYGQSLRSTILVAPHHGSNSSSSALFVNTVQPRVALYAVGRYNRWGFPKERVMARYQALGAVQLDSGESGAITLFYDNGNLWYRAEREQGAWYRRGGAWWKPRLWLE